MDSSIALAKTSASFQNFERSFDVFLSFRGEDTRSNFTSHLDMALRQKGINVFIDDKLDRGEQISKSLFKFIEGALISIVIFSENYASSSWCLDELVKIIECMKFKGQIVWPIFYKVDPSDIRKQTGSYGEALTTHKAKFKTKIQIWREALTIAANLSGWHLGTRKEADLIQDLVKDLLSILNRLFTRLYVAKYPVGIDSQLKNLWLLFHYWTQHKSSIGVYMVGIYGIGGIGKTTLAKALYNKLANQFEACCFLSNVREASKQFNGLVQLQEYLLHEILKEDLKVGNLDKGINIIRNRLCSKKVLIALDDVNKLEQFEALIGGHDWFGPGSKIIVTTRNDHLLSAHEFDAKYRIRGMNHNNALELFSWHAFKKCHPPSNYLDLSERATSYCKGHPLALVVLGSFLYTRYDQAEWRSILEEFESSLNKDIKDILQISFDGLEKKVQEIFLDISCLLVGEKVKYVENILNACHLNPNFGIIVLKDLSLITVENDKVQMHDLIQQMGHKIVNDESSKPRKRSRLWLVEDVLKVLIDNRGAKAVRAIKLDLPNFTRLDVNPQAFRDMKNLKLFIVRNAIFSTNVEYLPDELKWIKWQGFTHQSLPSCFIKKNLVGLELKHSLIKNLENGFKDCKRLKLVDLSYSPLLEKIPDFSPESSLEELYLSNCTNLKTIPTSVISLGKLATLDLNHCSNFKKLPSYLMLKSLKVLNLSFCKKLEELPDFSTASNLEELYLEECTNLRMIHESIVSLNELVILNLRKCSNLEKLPSYLRLKSLEELNLSDCCKLEMFPEIDENMKSLKDLQLGFTAIKELPSSIGYLTELYSLDLDGCTNLISLPSTIYLLPNLPKLQLDGCSRLEMFPHEWDPTIYPVCSSSKPMFPYLFWLHFRSCNISNADFLEILCDVAPSLYFLDLSENKFSSLPSCLHKFKSLQILLLRNCKFLQQIPDLPQDIIQMNASGCESLARSPDNIVDIFISCKQDLRKYRMFFLMNGEIQKRMNEEIVERFSYQSISNLMKVSFRHYLNIERLLAAYVMFKVEGHSYQENASISYNIGIGNQLINSICTIVPSSTSEYMWLVSASSSTFKTSLVANDWNDVIVWFDVSKCSLVSITITSCGVHLTEVVHEIQNDVGWQKVIYKDFDQSEKLPSNFQWMEKLNRFSRFIGMSSLPLRDNIIFGLMIINQGDDVKSAIRLYQVQ